jgi:hypothetical protein
MKKSFEKAIINGVTTTVFVIILFAVLFLANFGEIKLLVSDLGKTGIVILSIIIGLFFAGATYSIEEKKADDARK